MVRQDHDTVQDTVMPWRDAAFTRGHDHEQVEDDDVLQPDGAPKRFDEQPDEEAGDKGAHGPADTFSVKACSPVRLGGHG
jgi:hypothetical protein